MKDRLKTRLQELKAEYEKGKATLEELEAKAASVRSTMLRISGAIQVLEEELGRAGEPQAAPAEARAPAEPTNGKPQAAPTQLPPA
jgi:predicted nuclease with TOPRIM domain